MQNTEKYKNLGPTTRAYSEGEGEKKEISTINTIDLFGNEVKSENEEKTESEKEINEKKTEDNNTDNTGTAKREKPESKYGRSWQRKKGEQRPKELPETGQMDTDIEDNCFDNDNNILYNKVYNKVLDIYIIYINVLNNIMKKEIPFVKLSTKEEILKEAMQYTKLVEEIVDLYSKIEIKEKIESLEEYIGITKDEAEMEKLTEIKNLLNSIGNRMNEK